jgi:DNA-binding NtrC family response regulator
MTRQAFAAEVLIADLDNHRFHATVARLPARLAVRRACSVEELQTATSGRADVVVIGRLSGGSESMTAVHLVRESLPSARVILIAESSSEALVLSALRAGVSEYLNAPASGLDVAEAITRFLPPDEDDDICAELVGSSQEMRELKTMVRRIANMNATVLITGETGTGKEVVARLIHRLSSRSEQPMICVNCAAIPETLLESELFGYEKGAFTGAGARHPGQLLMANGGTLLLDEIGDMSLSAQAKILRAIERREVQPLGGSRLVPLNIRILAATHRDLERLVDEGKFRSDLFFRLHVATLSLPPLRQRREDIPMLARHFLRQINREHGLQIEDFTLSAMRCLMSCDWPGNVRQLRNAIEGAAMVCDSRRLSEDDLRIPCMLVASKAIPMSVTGHSAMHPTTKSEPERLRHALEATQWNVTRTAQLLSWSRMTVYRKLAKYQLERTPQPMMAP